VSTGRLSPNLKAYHCRVRETQPGGTHEVHGDVAMQRACDGEAVVNSGHVL